MHIPITFLVFLWRKETTKPTFLHLPLKCDRGDYLDETSCFDLHGTAAVEKKTCGSMWAMAVEHAMHHKHVHGVFCYLNMPRFFFFFVYPGQLLCI